MQYLRLQETLPQDEARRFYSCRAKPYSVKRRNPIEKSKDKDSPHHCPGPAAAQHSVSYIDDDCRHETGIRMKREFERIYELNSWGHGSGEGSLPIHVRPYVLFLQTFLRKRGIASVVDFGCGDWQFSKFVDWRGVDYHGYDIVGSVIATNRVRYQTGRVTFEEVDRTGYDLPAADLLIVKDVLQHWSDESIREFLPRLAGYRYSLITNCVNPRGPTTHQSIADGGFRYLDIRQPPFNMAAREALSFSNHRPFLNHLFGRPRWLKKVLLVEQSTVQQPAE